VRVDVNIHHIVIFKKKLGVFDHGGGNYVPRSRPLAANKIKK